MSSNEEDLAPVLAGEGSTIIPLEYSIGEYGEWDLVSHTFDLRNDDTAIVALIFEHKARRVN